MVVGQDHRRRVVFQGGGEQLAHIHLGGIKAALVEHRAAEHPALPVQTGEQNGLLLPPDEAGQQKAPRLLGGSQAEILLLLAVIDPGELRQQLEEARRIFADALHLLQLLRRGVQNAGQTAEIVHQPVGQLVGILPRDGIKQQQLQNIVLVKAVQPFPQKALEQPLPVSVVQTHAGLPLSLSMEVL